MVLVITDNLDLSMVYATTLGGVMIGKQSIRRKNMDEFRGMLLAKEAQEGALSTFFRGEQYVFVCLPFEAYALNRMADYQEEYKALQNRPIPYFPSQFGYRACGEETPQRQRTVERLVREATSVVNAVSDSIAGMLAFLHFQKVFQVSKPITRACPSDLSEVKILETFNSREDAPAEQDFADACLLLERLNWLVNCNVSNAIMQATNGRTTMAAGRIEAVLLKSIERATSSAHAPSRIYVLEKTSGLRIPCLAAAPGRNKVSFSSIKKGLECEWDKSTMSSPGHRAICNCFSILLRAGIEYGIPLHEASDALWRLYVNGYITWPSTSQEVPWSLKPLLTSAVSMLAQSSHFKGKIRPSDVEKYCTWDKENDGRVRTATIVTSKQPTELEGVDATLYRIVGEGIVREFSSEQMVAPSFRCNGTSITSACSVPVSTLSNGRWEICSVPSPGDTVYKDCDLLLDILPYFQDAFCEDFRYFLSPLDNLLIWGMIDKADDGNLSVTPRGELLLRYISSTPLVDPEATTFWDSRIKRVASGRVAAKTVLDDAGGYINDLVAYVRVTVEALEATGGISPSDCVCPVCGAPLEWDSSREGWSCTSTKQGCNFVLPGKFRGHTLSVRDMAMLLTKGETDLAFDFMSPQKGVYPARITFTPEKHLSLSFRSQCICPKCKVQFLNEFQWGLACPDKKCGFTLNTKKNGVRLTEEDEIHLFAGEKTRWIRDFVSARGKPFVARLYLTEDYKIKFEFPEKK